MKKLLLLTALLNLTPTFALDIGTTNDGERITRDNIQSLKDKLISADFSGNNCSNLDFSDAYCPLAKFNKADLSDADFNRADCTQALFQLAIFRSVTCNYSQFGDADFSNADCTKTFFKGVLFFRTNFSNVIFSNVTFKGGIFEGADFEGAIFQGAIFQEDENQQDESPRDRDQESNTISEALQKAKSFKGAIMSSTDVEKLGLWNRGIIEPEMINGFLKHDTINGGFDSEKVIKSNKIIKIITLFIAGEGTKEGI